MSGTSVPASEPIPNCPKCERPMVRRTARRGSNAGSDFWGCSEFPRCRGVVAYEPTVEAPVGEGSVVVAAADEDQGGVEEATTPDADGKRDGFLMKVARTVDKGWRWYLESDEPDAAARPAGRNDRLDGEAPTGLCRAVSRRGSIRARGIATKPQAGCEPCCKPAWTVH